MKKIVVAILLLFAMLFVYEVAQKHHSAKSETQEEYNPRCILLYYGLLWDLSGC